MSRIFLDTNFFIYLIEGVSPQSVRARYLIRAFAARRDEVLTSVMSIGEVLVTPLRNGDFALAQRYRRIFRGQGITVLPFAEPAAEAFARIRIVGTVKPPDAIQLATAGTAGCDLFLTNDERLLGVRVPGIHFITSFDKAPI
ncbi:MAG TPA: type II toxin-antitoxin system VapC family toxin [Terracidiphilus sp.]|jgi:predicted nucleic acid-binding protein|nr:type II toxin-antitoxin system VapC family toxin [Terracidiphilus sp.]